jgi:hypothetical protein
VEINYGKQTSDNKLNMSKLTQTPQRNKHGIMADMNMQQEHPLIFVFIFT